MSEHFCDTCKKNYTSYKSLWNHTKKFHTDDKLTNKINLSTNNTNFSTNKTNLSTNKINLSTNNTNIKIIEKKSIDILQCGYCNKIFKHRSDKCVHIKSCKLEHTQIQIINTRNICNICNKKFVFPSAIYKHKQTCKKKKEKEDQEKQQQEEEKQKNIIKKKKKKKNKEKN